MFRTFTKDELIERWRLVRHLEPQRADVTVTYDGFDGRELDEAAVDGWWYHTVDRAPLAWLHTVEMRQLATVTPTADGEGLLLTMTADKPLHRVGRLSVKGWLAPAIRVTPEHYIAHMQRNEWCRAGVTQPVAVMIDPWHWELYPAAEGELDTLQVVDESDYTMDERCLTLMESYEPTNCQES